MQTNETKINWYGSMASALAEFDPFQGTWFAFGYSSCAKGSDVVGSEMHLSKVVARISEYLDAE